MHPIFILGVFAALAFADNSPTRSPQQARVEISTKARWQSYVEKLETQSRTALRQLSQATHAPKGPPGAKPESPGEKIDTLRSAALAIQTEFDLARSLDPHWITGNTPAKECRKLARDRMLVGVNPQGGGTPASNAANEKSDSATDESNYGQVISRVLGQWDPLCEAVGLTN